MFDLLCHHCSHWMGESSEPLEFLGMFKNPSDRNRVDGPRSSWRCKSCGWVNVFRKLVGGRRPLETKC
jgi:hypothetical protein